MSHQVPIIYKEYHDVNGHFRFRGSGPIHLSNPSHKKIGVYPRNSLPELAADGMDDHTWPYSQWPWPFDSCEISMICPLNPIAGPWFENGTDKKRGNGIIYIYVLIMILIITITLITIITIITMITIMEIIIVIIITIYIYMYIHTISHFSLGPCGRAQPLRRQACPRPLKPWNLPSSWVTWRGMWHSEFSTMVIVWLIKYDKWYYVMISIIMINYIQYGMVWLIIIILMISIEYGLPTLFSILDIRKKRTS